MEYSRCSFDDILRSHFSRYPAMLPQDAVKLCYQSEFGGAHLIDDRAAFADRIRRERELCAEPSEMLEPVGGGLFRIYLSPASENIISDAALCSMCIDSAARTVGSPSGFHQKLDILRRLAFSGKAPFSADALSAYLEKYLSDGCPVVRHSEEYRRAYSPAYRIITEGYARLIPLLRAVDLLLASKERAAIALEGPAAAGKTTAAALLADIYGANIISVDSFFLPPDKRTPERLQTPGGNVDHERFAAQVSPYIGTSLPFSYGVYDCSSCRISRSEHISPKRLLVTEGVYSTHPEMNVRYDLRVFLDVGEDCQLARLKARGEELYLRFVSEWLPMEREYFSHFDVKNNCDIIL